ncbi:MAG: antitoxin family protein [Methanoregula sp.]|nr:antitoxin family protein [Methanoregula sp.]
MTKAIEVIYENNVFKPLGRVEGIKEHERMVAIFSRSPVKKRSSEFSRYDYPCRSSGNAKMH